MQSIVREALFNFVAVVVGFAAGTAVERVVRHDEATYWDPLHKKVYTARLSHKCRQCDGA